MARADDTDPIYLDCNASTPILPEVAQAMTDYLHKGFGNPSSGHIFGRCARRAVDKARHRVAQLLGCSPSEVVFTSGGTEANNLAIFGVCTARQDRPGVVTSAIEHPATAEPCRRLAAQDRSVSTVAVDRHGRVELDQIRDAISDQTALVTVMHANNETGVIQPVQQIAEIAAYAGATVHSDAAQSVGKVDVDVDELGVDLLSVAAHKMHGPKGVGALYIRRGTPIESVLYGASHENGMRPGTENVASIVGFGVACEIAAETLEISQAKIGGLRDRLWEKLNAEIPEIVINGHRSPRLPNTLNVRFPSVSGDRLLAHADGVAASTGSACHGGEHAASSVIVAMGIEPEEAAGSVRLSLGKTTTSDEIDRAATALVGAWNSMVSQSSR